MLQVSFNSIYTHVTTAGHARCCYLASCAARPFQEKIWPVLQSQATEPKQMSRERTLGRLLQILQIFSIVTDLADLPFLLGSLDTE